MANPLVDALEALAGLEGRTISELLDDIARQHLRSMGHEPRITGDDISGAIGKKPKKAKS